MRTRPDSDFWCLDCRSADYGQFMVHDSVWAASGADRHAILCRSCLERRLGRLLTHDDFTLAPLNFQHVEGFDTERNLRRLFESHGVDYDAVRAEYMERCARLGFEPRGTTAPQDGSM